VESEYNEIKGMMDEDGDGLRKVYKNMRKVEKKELKKEV
jgi:hypothetical protein